MANPIKPKTKQPSAYQVAWGLFACLSVVQLVAIGAAIAVRSGDVREVVRYVREDPIIVSVPTLPDVPQASDQIIQPRSLEQLMLAYSNESPDEAVPSANPLAAPDPVPASQGQSTVPFSADTPALSPKLSALLEKAEKARKAGDSIQALILLGEAQELEKDAPVVQWRQAEVFESMGQWERAADCYESLFLMGPSIGNYYHQAAYKLSNGAESQGSKSEMFALGFIMKRVSEDAQSVQLRIPVKRVENERFDPADVHLVVHHYDLVDRHKVEAVPDSRADQMNERWLHAPVDWANNEEVAEANYEIPAMNASEAHLFGQRSYFGYVVELYYQNELIDQQAQPRKLHSIHAQKQVMPSYGLPFDGELPPINEGNPLLPNLPSL